MNNVHFDEPSFYQIIVLGEVSQNITDMINGSDLKIEDQGSETHSIIKVWVKDQAHMIGIMNMLYDLHYVIIKVDCLEYHDKGINV